MKEKVIKYIKENNMLNINDSVVIGVSGGSDSMCLFSILLELKSEYSLKLYVVHINHCIRGENANKDMEYVEKICKENDIECFAYKIDVNAMAKEKRISTEEAGRIARYEKFYEIAGKYNAKIAVAHNMSDNAETVLFNMFRGSGIRGMAGILPKRDNIIRPIMCLSKEEIYEYLEKNKIEYRVDESNFTEEYTRNKIRLNILPYVTENINEKAVLHINELSRSMVEISEYIDEEAERLSEKYVTFKSNENIAAVIDEQLFQHKNIVASQVVRKAVYKVAGKLKDITRVHIESIASLKEKQVGASVSLPYGMVATREYKDILLQIEKKEACKFDNAPIKEIQINDFGIYDILELNEKISLSCDKFSKQVFKENMYTKWISYDILKGSLSLRTRQTGDYIVINDKGSKKSIKDFFIDSKIPKNQRDRVLLLTKGHEVLWIIGYRLSAKYKVSENSEHIIKVDIIK